MDKVENRAALDANIVKLVDALNAFEGIRTIGSCGGHANPGPGQWEEGTWYINFDVDLSEDGWFALEFLAWFINNINRKSEGKSILYPYAAPPHYNTPGQMLVFHLEGYGDDPDELAAALNHMREQHYVAPNEVDNFLSEDDES